MTLLPATPGDVPTVRLSDPAALVAALPHLLGFRPRDSLVLVALGGASGRRLGLTLRVDLPPRPDVEAVCDVAAENLMLGRPDGAAVFVIGGPGPARRGARSGPPRRDVADAAVAALAARGVPARIVGWAARCRSGAQWRCYDPCACGGTLPDPSGTAYAAHAVAEGQVVFADREELERLVAPVDAAVLQRREALIVSGPAGAALDDATARALVDAAVADAANGRLELDDEQVVRLAQALALPLVRDAALVRCAGPDAAAAEQLWAALARETPDPEAAAPAALLAASALLRGKGAMANIALDRAEQAWPGHRLTALLRTAVVGGVRPEQFRAWLTE